VTARRFQLPAHDVWKAVGALFVPNLVLLALTVGFCSEERSPEHETYGFALLCALCVCLFWLAKAVSGAVREWRKPSARSVDVGMDGVLIGERFIPYADIGDVAHRRRTAVLASPDAPHEVQESQQDWIVSLTVGGLPGGGVLLGGETIEIVTERSRSAAEDPLGADIARAIEEGLAAWAARRRNDGPPGIARGERTSAEWLEALRALGGGAGASYRSGALDLEKLSRVLEDPRQKPVNRAVAAVVLAAAGDRTAPRKLRIAAEAVVNQRVRIALENLADETAEAEALEALEEAEARNPRS
jgi:hypothetical protein